MSMDPMWKKHPSDMHSILVDAATAFGSGQHSTTAGCLLILDQLAPLNPKTALDMGCGSGILALAMASLWACPILACDNDFEAVRVTQENAILNKLDDHLQSFQSEGFASPRLKEEGPFEIITANILAGPLIEMAGDMRIHTTLGGKIVLSGLLITQAPQVIVAYEAQGFRLLEEKPIQEWMTLLMERSQ
ncbi:Ribosomal protein L11 methyltransferase domain protein [Candidatus Bealeia paramacronuclearis]|uniref:Ribosomal protein L11 methyltransferase domain protein n=2 Tax=Candidatus Bealeia paramacronuclearis TaxID=1921001 RepID=A0ABZ2CBA6_9PROT